MDRKLQRPPRLGVPARRRLTGAFIFLPPLLFFFLPYLIWRQDSPTIATVAAFMVALVCYLVVTTLITKEFSRGTVSRYGFESKATITDMNYISGKSTAGNNGFSTQDVEIKLNVNPDGMPMFQSSDRLTIPVVALHQFQVGDDVTVRFDPRHTKNRVVITTEPNLNNDTQKRK